MLKHPTNDAQALALSALAATLADDRRARRFLDLTGLDSDALRTRVLAGDTSLFGALVDFLSSHEPDLVAVAAAIGVEPAALIALERDLP